MSENTEPIEATVAELKPRMKNVNITFKVVEVSEAREVTSRDDGSTHRIVDAKVADTTGTVIVPLWDDAIEKVQVGSTYRLENGYTGLFRTNLRLNIGRYGVINPAKEEIADVDTSNDVSAVEHERNFHRGGPRRSFSGPPRGESDHDRGGYSGGSRGGGFGGSRDRGDRDRGRPSGGGRGGGRGRGRSSDQE